MASIECHQINCTAEHRSIPIPIKAKTFLDEYIPKTVAFFRVRPTEMREERVFLSPLFDRGEWGVGWVVGRAH